jgi:predicted transcriptional regulator YdeE
MNTQIIETFHVIGITVRTTNANQQAATDILALWQRFMQEAMLDEIPNKIDDTVYSIYTDYEKDHTTPYTILLCCRVSNLDTIPTGMIGKTIPTALYQKFTATGDLMQGVVYQTWETIWATNIERAYTNDLEIYGPKAQDAANAQVDVFIAIK